MATAPKDMWIIKATPSMQQVAGQLEKVRRRVDPSARDAAQDALQVYYLALKESAPHGKHYTLSGEVYETHFLYNGIKLRREPTGSTYARVVVEGKRAVDHAKYVINGVEQHDIYPHTSKGMTFYWPKMPSGMKARRAPDPGRGRKTGSVKLKQTRGPSEKGSTATWGDKVVTLFHVSVGYEPTWFPNVTWQATRGEVRNAIVWGFKTKIEFTLNEKWF